MSTPANPTTAQYVAAVRRAIDANVTLPVTDRCPECNAQVQLGDTDHVTTTYRGQAAVVVGCEGYWVINPALVGINSPRWES